MRNIRGFVNGACVLVLLGATACKGGGSSAAATPAAASAAPLPVASVAPSASASPSASPQAPTDPDLATLTGRLASEGRNRPDIKPNADDVMGALTKTGGALTRGHASLGSTYKARFCTGGYVANESLAVNVCEFTDEASATAGLAYANTVFPNMKNRKVWSHKATTLTVIEQKSDEATLAIERKLAATYQTL